MKLPMKVKTVRVIDQDALYREIGKRLRALREERGWPQQQVGNAIGHTRASIANIEGAKQRLPIHTAYDLALLFDVPLSKVLPWAEDR